MATLHGKLTCRIHPSCEGWSRDFSIDQDLAETTRQEACPSGGHLHRDNYPRKPRGGPDDLPQQYRCRLRFCCDRDGCRKRFTPPSVRFLGPKVYLGAVVVLVAAMRQRPSPRRVRQLSELFGADRRSIARWQIFWREHFPQTRFWKVARARLVPAIEDDARMSLRNVDNDPNTLFTTGRNLLESHRRRVR
jgi:hypothetical protein